jgi:hypothetical protein
MIQCTATECPVGAGIKLPTIAMEGIAKVQKHALHATHERIRQEKEHEDFRNCVHIVESQAAQLS